MRETAEDMAQLQRLLDQSIAQAGDFLRSSFQMPKLSLSARQLAHYFTGVKNVALATSTQKGEPRVAPIRALFVRGHFAIPTTAGAARTRHIQQRPALSLTHFIGNELAIIVHGRATVLSAAQPTFADIDAVYRALTGDSPSNWGEGVYLHIHADVIYTYARSPEAYPED